MTPKQQAVAEAKRVLLHQQQELRNRICKNKWSLKQIAEQNAVAKRELKVLNDLLWTLDGKKNRE